MSLENHLSNKNVQAFLGMIRDAEGTSNKSDPYRTRFGGQVDESLDLNGYPTFVKKQFTQTDGKKNLSGAVGAYQFIEKTWKGLAKNYGFKDFSPKTQDMAAIALLKERGALPFILRGDFQTALKKAGPIWASLPTSPYPQHKRSQDFVQRSLQKYLEQPVELSKSRTVEEQEVADTPKTKAPTQSTSQVARADNKANKHSVETQQGQRTMWGKIRSLFSRKA